MLILEPGSATYHNLFLIVPFVLITPIILLHKRQLVLVYVFIFFLIGFLPSWLNKYTQLNGSNHSHASAFFIFSYHRLWLEMIFFGFTVYFLNQFIKGQHNQKSNEFRII